MRQLASIQVIRDIIEHNNADTLEIAKVLGWTLCVMKGQFKKDEKIVFVEPDAILPEGKLEWEFMRPRGFRLKTIKLRGVISQGLCFPLSILPEGNYEEGQYIDGILGITQYQPYTPAQLAGEVKGSFPDFLFKSDEMRIQAVPELLEKHQNKKFYVSEKLDGTSFSCFLKDGETFGVCSRNLELKETEGNSYWKIARELDLEDKLRNAFGDLALHGRSFGLQGELIGCFHYDTPIRMGDYTTTKIGDLYNKFKRGEDLKVLSFNKETQLLEISKVTHFSKTKMLDEWITLEYRHRGRYGSGGNHIVTTPNHLFFTRGLIEKQAKDLNIGDTIFTFSTKKPTYVQEQVILGSLLGDGSFEDNMFYCAHSEVQQDYLLYKKYILSSLITNTFEKISGFGSKMLGLNTCSLGDKLSFDIKSLTYQNGKKQVSLKYLEKLSPIAWAFWYMDDGCLSVAKDIKYANKQPKCSLSTHGFSEESVDNIISYFNNKGIQCTKIPVNNHSSLQYFVLFTVEGSKAFQSLIAPYVHQSMQYKLAGGFQNICNNFFNAELLKSLTGLIETSVTSISRGSFFKDCNKHKYDFEVENTHCYFANNILVHNSGVQGNKYKLPNLQLKLFNIFDIDMQRNLDYDIFKEIANILGLDIVPIINESYLLPKTVEELVEFSKGQSLLNKNVLREGIVLRPLMEEYSEDLRGRLSFKTINPLFLLKYNE